MKKIIPLSILALVAQVASANVLFQYDFNEPAGTRLVSGFNGPQSTVPTPSVTWNQGTGGSTPALTDGAGNLVISSTLGNVGFQVLPGIKADTGTYELAFNGVQFNNFGASDHFTMAFFTSFSGSPLPSTSSTRAFLRAGNLDGTAGIDFRYGKAANEDNTFLNSGSLTRTFDFIISIDTNAKEASFYYVADNGERVQVGSTLTGMAIGTDDSLTGGAAGASFRAIGMSATLSAGASIAIDQVLFSSVIPEPSTYALIGGLLVAGIALVRRRR